MAGSVTAKELKECFESLDFDGDGLISKKEMALAVRALGKNPTEKELNAFFESLGASQLSVDFATYKTAFGKPYQGPTDQDKALRDAFKMLDSDGDGTILESELRQILLTIGESMSHQEVDQLMQNVEVDVNGKIKYDSFIDMVVHGCPVSNSL